MDRKTMIREYNTLRTEFKSMFAQLEKMESHEGEDGCPEDIDGQIKLQEEMRLKRLRISELKKLIYPS